MKIFDGCPVAQGDIMIVAVSAVPEKARLIESEGGRFILAHSETGHHHIIMERPGVKFSAMDEFRSYLTVTGDPADLVHERSFDTHETIRLPAGTYEIRRQREYVSEGFRRAAD